MDAGGQGGDGARVAPHEKLSVLFNRARASLAAGARDAASPADEPLLIAEGIDKAFGATRALDGVDLRLRAGEVHALLGENGAGKSTLMKVLLGIEGADGGSVTFNGQARVAHLAQDHGLDLDFLLKLSSKIWNLFLYLYLCHGVLALSHCQRVHYRVLDVFLMLAVLGPVQRG